LRRMHGVLLRVGEIPLWRVSAGWAGHAPKERARRRAASKRARLARRINR
jgi:hypothetical protein